jgi:hypothetical protein
MMDYAEFLPLRAGYVAVMMMVMICKRRKGKVGLLRART